MERPGAPRAKNKKFALPHPERWPETHAEHSSCENDDYGSVRVRALCMGAASEEGSIIVGERYGCEFVPAMKGAVIFLVEVSRL